MQLLSPTLSLTFLGSGIAAGVMGILGRNQDLAAAGLFVAIAAIPLAVIGVIQDAQRVGEDQIAAAHTAGYRLALDHVARGLLDQNAPRGGGEHQDNVVPFRLPPALPDRAAR